jgi:hypothetical protein
MLTGAIKKFLYLISSLAVVCAGEDKETRFKEALFCAFGNRSQLNAYGTSMRATGEIIGKVKRKIAERGLVEGSRG